MNSCRSSAAMLLLALMPLQACTRDSRAAEVPRAPQQGAGGDLAGRFVSHQEHIQPAGVKPFTGLQLVNPHEGDAKAAAMGGKLFVAYNCVDCHGADGSGAMGPSLADNRWHFGGTAPEVFESIYQGRPEGMPAWGSLISEDQVWMLVTYVRSLSKGKDVTTENFGGKTVERTGH
ncbi:MAG: cytochrome c class [Gemmatimonadetes bacterium]|nr:cytochrome c class [Gemmatimonadota bacterium]